MLLLGWYSEYARFILICCVQINSPSAGEEDMERLRENMEELEALFQVEEEQEGIVEVILPRFYFNILFLALDDDNNKLTEVPELFSTAKFPLKYDKLLKVSLIVEFFVF